MENTIYRENYLTARLSQKNKLIAKLQREVGYWRNKAIEMQQKLDPIKEEYNKPSRNLFYNLLIKQVTTAIQSEYPEFNEDFLTTKSRKREICEQRQMFMYIMQMKRVSCKFVGLVCGGRDHSTALAAKDTIQDLIDTNPVFRKKIYRIMQKLEDMQ